MELGFQLGTLAIAGKAYVRPRGSLRLPDARELIVPPSSFGAFNPDGSVAEDTLRRAGLNGKFTDFPGPLVPERLPEDLTIAAVIDEPVIWGGGISDHYGHFLTEFVARLWPLLSIDGLSELPVVFSGRRNWQFVNEWLSAFGVKTINVPTQQGLTFKRMYVPEPAWRLSAWVAPEMRDIHLKARRGLKLPFVVDSELTWLSRGGLPWERVPYDEALLEWLLRSAMRVLRPERMSLAEQVASFEASTAVAGVAGSAFHTALMVREMSELIYLCPSIVSAPFIAQESLLKRDARFVHALAATSMQPKPSARRPASFRLMIPEVIRSLKSKIPADLITANSLLSALTEPEQVYSQVGEICGDRQIDLDTAILQVVLDPLSMGARMNLGQIFERQEVLDCALEQFRTVAELTEDYVLAPLRAARLLFRLDRRAEAAAMAKKVLAIDQGSKEALRYIA